MAAYDPKTTQMFDHYSPQILGEHGNSYNYFTVSACVCHLNGAQPHIEKKAFDWEHLEIKKYHRVYYSKNFWKAFKLAKKYSRKKNNSKSQTNHM